MDEPQAIQVDDPHHDIGPSASRAASYSARSPTGGGEWPFDYLHGVYRGAS